MLFGAGITGLVILLALFVRLLRSKIPFVKIAAVVFLILFITDDSFNSYMSVFYLSLLLFDRELPAPGGGEGGMSTILFIVTESESANGICARAVMKELTARGHRVLCITNREYGQRKDYALGGIQYYAVKPRLVYRISSYLSRSGVKGLRRRLIAGGEPAAQQSQAACEHSHVARDFAAVYRQAIQYGPGRVPRLAGVLCDPDLHPDRRRHRGAQAQVDGPGILYIPYFLDSLSGGYGPRCFSPARTLKRCLNLERRLLANADRIIAMKSSRTHHALHSAGSAITTGWSFSICPC